MAAHPHGVRGQIDEEILRGVLQGEKLKDEENQAVAGAGEQTDIGPVIDILFNRERGERGPVDAAAQLREIRVTMPTNVPEQMAITGMERNEVTTSAMIRAQHEPGRGEVTERGRNVTAR